MLVSNKPPPPCKFKVLMLIKLAKLKTFICLNYLINEHFCSFTTPTLLLLSSVYAAEESCNSQPQDKKKQMQNKENKGKKLWCHFKHILAQRQRKMSFGNVFGSTVWYAYTTLTVDWPEIVIHHDFNAVNTQLTCSKYGPWITHITYTHTHCTCDSPFNLTKGVCWLEVSRWWTVLGGLAFLSGE